ncbi:DUF4019 domain-containing protein [Massilia sp. LjRoot122]|uniref:DUF4019 domain-containing protein n=1 Tax=Massilia sp. LjRoot122 TaxID=3342257 RepID=UPI003ECEDB6A
MRFAAAVLLSTAALIQPASAQDTSAATQAATTAAQTWLATVDDAKYEDSWSQGAAAFRSAVTGQQWNDAMRAVRAPLGAVKSRKLLAAQYTRKLPGAPEGEYVVVQYLTEFAARTATETVTPMREADGSWKVSGYYIQ